MAIKKRCLLWDWTNTKDRPQVLNSINFDGPLSSVSNWNTWTPPELNGRAPFRPMVRQMPNLEGQEWSNIRNSDQPIIHFFNEPERAGISPEQAAEKWNSQMLPLRNEKGKKLVSPSCSNDENGQAWLENFMSLVSQNPPDFLGLHYYGTNGNDATSFIQSMHSKYPSQPIIVSEIASISRNYDEVLSFTAELANWMDNTEWIFEYGFFGCMAQCADGFVSPDAQLMNSDGSLRDLMYKLMFDQPINAGGASAASMPEASIAEAGPVEEAQPAVEAEPVKEEDVEIAGAMSSAPGPGIVLTNKSGTDCEYFFFDNYWNGNGTAGANFDHPLKSVRLSPGEETYVDLPTSFKGRVQRGTQLPATWVEFQVSADNDSAAHGDISLQQGCDGAATIAATDGSGRINGFSEEILSGAPGEAFRNKPDGTRALDTTVGNWNGGPNQATIDYLNRVVGRQKAYILGGSGTDDVASSNQCLAVDMY